jgi:hypothetical protein
MIRLTDRIAMGNFVSLAADNFVAELLGVIQQGGNTCDIALRC